MTDSKKPVSKDVDRLFGRYGLDAGGYSDRRQRPEEPDLADRWPLLGELRARYQSAEEGEAPGGQDHGSQNDLPAEPPRRRQPPKREEPVAQTKAKRGADRAGRASGPASASTSFPAGRKPAKAEKPVGNDEQDSGEDQPGDSSPPDLYEIFGDAAGGRKIRGATHGADDARDDRPSRASTIAEDDEDEGEGPSLAEAFGMTEDELDQPRRRRSDGPVGKRAATPSRIQSAPRGAPSAESPGGEPSNPARGSLEATLTRLRSGDRLATGSKNSASPADGEFRNSLKRLNSKFRKEGKRRD